MPRACLAVRLEGRSEVTSSEGDSQMAGHPGAEPLALLTGRTPSVGRTAGV